jgi:hypothetical protein
MTLVFATAATRSLPILCLNKHCQEFITKQWNCPLKAKATDKSRRLIRLNILHVKSFQQGGSGDDLQLSFKVLDRHNIDTE